jgi:ankyrin repeat protein
MLPRVVESVEAIEFLVQRGGSSPSGTVQLAGSSLLHGAAARKAPVEVVRCLLGGQEQTVQVRDGSFSGSFPLHLAASNGAPLAVVRLLALTWGQALRETESDGCLPLHHAASSAASVEVIQFLLAVTGEETVLEEDDHGRLPLHHAASSGAPTEVLQHLVDTRGVALSGRDRDGCLPMHLAVRWPASLDGVEFFISGCEWAFGKMIRLAGSHCTMLPARARRWT